GSRPTGWWTSPATEDGPGTARGGTRKGGGLGPPFFDPSPFAPGPPAVAGAPLAWHYTCTSTARQGRARRWTLHGCRRSWDRSGRTGSPRTWHAGAGTRTWSGSWPRTVSTPRSPARRWR